MLADSGPLAGTGVRMFGGGVPDLEPPGVGFLFEAGAFEGVAGETFGEGGGAGEAGGFLVVAGGGGVVLEALLVEFGHAHAELVFFGVGLDAAFEEGATGFDPLAGFALALGGGGIGAGVVHGGDAGVPGEMPGTVFPEELDAGLEEDGELGEGADAGPVLFFPGDGEGDPDEVGGDAAEAAEGGEGEALAEAVAELKGEGGDVAVHDGGAAVGEVFLPGELEGTPEGEEEGGGGGAFHGIRVRGPGRRGRRRRG